MYKKWLSGYQFVAVQVFTLLLLVLVVNVLLALFYFYKDQALKKTNPIVLKYGRDALRSVYPTYSDQEQDVLLTETWTRKQQYESFTGFKEAAFQGKYLNVHPAGFRIGWQQGPWPLDSQFTNVFVFGGSTTFGYGVADAETLPSHLQRVLQKKHSKVKCYNFGRGFYYSEQERALFEKLLVDGIRPDLVVFVDGLNEYAQAEPEFLEQTQALFAQQTGTLFQYWFQGLPISRMARSLRFRLLGISPEPPEPIYSCVPDSIQKVHLRYWQNRKLIEVVANSAQIPTLFVWQPISCFQYKPKDDFFLTAQEAGNCYPGCGYAQMAKEWAKNAGQLNSAWLADIQKGRTTNRYVDKVHYTAAFNAEIADSIGAQLSIRGFLNLLGK